MCNCGSRWNLSAGRHETLLTSTIGRRMKQCYNDVEVEPLLQPLTRASGSSTIKTVNKENRAKSDLRMHGFWTDANFRIL